MEIALIIPPDPSIISQKNSLVGSVPPLGLAILSSIIKNKGHSVQIIDLFLEIQSKKGKLHSNLVYELQNLNEKDIGWKYLDGIIKAPFVNSLITGMTQNINPFNYNLIGFSIMNSGQLLTSLLISKKLKENNKKLKIVFGGSFINNISTEILKKYEFIDYIIINEGEIAVEKLLDFLEGKTPITNVPNLTYKTKQNKIQTNKIEYMDINNIPPPDFSQIDLQLYKTKGIFMLPYDFMRGCNSRCAFCTHRLPQRQVCEFRNIDKIIDDLNRLIKKYNTKFFYFTSNTINSYPPQLNSLCEKIIDQNLNIKWHSYASPSNLDEKQLKNIAKSGCVQLKWGVESGSQTTLNNMLKGNKIKEIEKILKLSNKVGIWNYALFIYGFPLETEKEFKETQEFIKKNKDVIDFGKINEFTVLPGSSIFNNPQHFGIKNLRFGENIFKNELIFDSINNTPYQKYKEENMKKRVILRECLKAANAKNRKTIWELLID